MTTFAYDYRGRRTSVTDANGKTTTYAYDDADRLTSVTDAANNVTSYAYDTENNLTSITDASLRATYFTYDAFGRVTQVNFPSNLIESYAYDAVGNLTSKTDRKNQTINYLYDALDRLVSKTYPDSSQVEYVYDLVGKIQQVNDPTGSYSFAYDNLGRLVGTTTSYSFLTSRTFTVSYSYDKNSNRTQMTDPESGATTYAYDNLNRLTTLTPPSAFTSGSFGFSYDALSRRTALTRPNSVTTEYTYDNLSRLLSVLHKLSGNTIDGTSYTVDAVGNRTAKTDLPAAVTSSYSYDPIYQLTQVVKNAATTETYTYDPVGNRLSSLGVSPYSYNVSNQLTSTPTATFTYDANGNTTTKTDSTGTTTYAWDYENRLSSVTLPGSGGVVSFKYDPLGRRIYKSSTAATAIFAYDGDNMAEEVSSTGNPVARYAMGLSIDEPLAILRYSVTNYYQADGLGSVTSLSDSAGSLASTYGYDSFGSLTSTTGNVTNPFRYTAREWDAETGLYFYRARYYDAALGRFLTEDPAAESWDKSLYEYVGNTPLSFLDPLGLYEVHDRIRVHKTLDYERYCSETAAGACTRNFVTILTCNCIERPCQDPGGSSAWRASVNFLIYGDMYLYSGPFQLLRRRPRDRSVVDTASAEAHERNVHLTPAIEAVKPALRDLERKTFATETECKNACAAAFAPTGKLFTDTLARTQREENRR